jgi:hypothetical protein
MSTYSIHSPISSRHADESVALKSGTVIAIAATVIVALIAVAFLAAAPVISTNVKHIGRAAVVTATDQAGTTVVASNGAAPATAAKTATAVRPWRETLHGRALVLSRSEAPALAGPIASGQ